MGIVFFFFLFLGCSQPPTNQGTNSPIHPAYAKASAGKHFTNSPYSRIVSLAPSITEQLYLLGVEEKIIAVTNYCDYPPQVKKKEKVGTLLDPNIEKILTLKPDIVFASVSAQNRETINKLKRFGINVFTFGQVSNFSDISRDFLLLARMVGGEPKAKNFLSRKEKEIREIKQKVEKLPKVRVFLEIGARPLMTAAGKTFIDEIVSLAGGTNVFHEANLSRRQAGIEYPRISLEEVMRRNPEVIILATMGEVTEEETRYWQKYKNLEAVKRNRIYILDANIICRPTPTRYIEGLKEITKFLHPEINPTQ